MKKLTYLITLTLCLVSLVTYAQQERVEASEVIQQQEAVEIQVNELPEAVTNAIVSDLPEYKAEKAYKTIVDEQEAFWVILSKEEIKIKVLFNGKGKVIEHNDN